MADDLLDAIGALDKRAQQEPPKNELQDAIGALGQRAGQPDTYGQPTAPDDTSVIPTFTDQVPPAPTYRDAQEEGIGPGETHFGKVMGRLFGTDVNDPLPWTRMGTTIAGGVAGGIAGATQTPGPPILKGIGGFLGGMAGAVGGAAAPETTMEALEAAGIINEGTRDRLGLNNEDLMTVIEGEALLEAYTMGGISALRLGKRGLTNLFTGSTRASRDLAERASREGIAMLPVQVGEGRFARGFVSVMGRFPWVAGALKKKAQRSMDQIANAFNGVPQRFGPLTTFDEASASIMREAQHTVTAMQQHYGAEFTRILAQADFNRITVRPVNTRAVTTRLLKQMEKEVPVGMEGARGRVTKGQQALRQFIHQNTAILYADPEIADLAVRQMDTLLNVIDEAMVGAAKQSDAKTMGRYEQLRNAIQMDMINNASAPNMADANQFVAEFRRLDEELTFGVNTLLANATGSRLGAIISPTQRSARFSGLGTRGMDSLAQTLLRGDSVNAVQELQRLVPLDTMRQLTGSVMNDVVQKSFVNEGGNVVRFDADTFARQLGLDAPSSGKFRQTEALLNASGGMRMSELQTLVEVARRSSRAEIPDVSTFVARGATMGGLQRIWNVLIPGALIGGATAASVSSGMVLGIVTIGGSRLISRMISDPKSARALSRVMDEEVKQTVRWTAGVRAFEFGLQKLVESGDATQAEAANMMDAFNSYVDTFRDEHKRMEEDGE